MNGGIFIAIILVIVVIIILAIALFYLVRTGENLTEIGERVGEEASRIQVLQQRFLDTFSPYIDLGAEDAREFINHFIQDHCALATLFCDIQTYPALYDKRFCIPACETIIALSTLCQTDNSLQDNAICQLFPGEVTLEDLAKFTGLSVEEILELGEISPGHFSRSVRDH